MDKKDQKIEKMMDDYVRDVAPPPQALYPAVQLLRAQNAEKARRKKRLIRRGISFVAAAAAVILIFSFIINKLGGFINNTPSQSTQYYSLSQLSRKSVTIQELNSVKAKAGITADLFPDIDTDYDSSLTLFYFTDSGSPAFALLKTRRITARSVEEVKIIVELSDKRLEEYRDYEELEIEMYSGIAVNIKTEYVNGEYESKAALEKNNLKYYIEVSCPSKNAIDGYIEAVIGIG